MPVFEDVLVNREFQFSLGIERDSGRYYLSTQVSGHNRAVDYEQKFAIDRAQFDRFMADPETAVSFIEQCRNAPTENLFASL